MQKQIIFFISLLLLSHFSFAQRFVEEAWHEGTVLLESGDSLQGNLKFNLSEEIIQVDMRGSLQTLTSRKVLSFKFFDRFDNRNRSYYTLPFSKVADYKTPTFFELLWQGDHITLLNREAFVTQTSTNPYYGGFGMRNNFPVTYSYIKNNFYFLYKNSKIKLFDGTKKGILILLQDREKDIKNYLKDNRVRFDNKQDMIRLIDFYNALKNK